ncbi:hypothetical protein [Flammeovirga sp. SubArs3]|uniref:hypothetical protein n=1 Tax=Flammeovirga sp. SubArs3 TaxID=2995316 RepID=UPI00248ABF6B|nr:hypothetical protein [Flammeovirga sp. SubArs3]
MRTTAIILILLIFSLNSFSQCLEQNKISYGGNWNNYNYTYFCPIYTFSFGGDTSKTWNILNPIDINKISSQILPIKKEVERQILSYSGKEFLQDLNFLSVEIVYPDSINKFSCRRPQYNIDRCKAKYFFYYNYSPIENANYHIGIALNDSLEIVNELILPSKKEFRQIDKELTICKLINLSKRYKNQIEPIEKIKFEYDVKTKRFVWILSQGLIDKKEGINKYNEMIINASDSEKIEFRVSNVIITY